MSLGLQTIFNRWSGRSRNTGGVALADRALVLEANRLCAPASEHGLARWLDDDFICDRWLSLPRRDRILRHTAPQDGGKLW